MAHIQLVKNTALAGGHVSARQSSVRTGAMTASSIYSGMAILAAVGLGGAAFLVTAKPIYAGLGALAGLLIGAGLNKETEGA